jgi:hypothetical protein
MSPNPNAPPPEAMLMNLVMGKFVSKAISVVARLRVADHMTGPTSVEALASATNTNADALYRVMRALAAVGVFTESDGRRFALTPTGQALRTDHPRSMRAMCQMLNESWNWAAWGELEYSVKTGQPAFDKVYGTSSFHYFSTHPEESQIFGEAMTSLTLGVTAAVVDAYDFSPVKHVVDVGGSHGILAGGIVDRFSTVRATVFDLPHVIEEAKARLASHAHKDRIATAAGSFFEPLPKADAYIMKNILHDWDDASSVRILSQCRAAMDPGGRVLIVESLVTDSPESTFVKLLDLQMLAVLPGGRERTEVELAALLRSAGLELARVVRTASAFSVVEAHAA